MVLFQLLIGSKSAKDVVGALVKIIEEREEQTPSLITSYFRVPLAKMNT